MLLLKRHAWKLQVTIHKSNGSQQNGCLVNTIRLFLFYMSDGCFAALLPDAKTSSDHPLVAWGHIDASRFCGAKINANGNIWADTIPDSLTVIPVISWMLRNLPALHFHGDLLICLLLYIRKDITGISCASDDLIKVAFPNLNTH